MPKPTRNAAPETQTARTTSGSSLGKTTVPTLRRVFDNERLFARLDAARFYPVVWIHGAPGAGKTTLAASYLAARRVQALWCRLDEGDADPASVFLHLAEAAKLCAPGLNLPLLQPEFRTALRLFTRRFFRTLFGADGISTLVLDDYHEVALGAELHDCMPSGLEEVPQDCQVIVISRSAPPSQLARLRLNGKVDVVEPDALRLNTKEICALAHERGVEASAFAQKRIVSATQGWAAGAILLLEASIMCPSESETPLPEVLFDYFAGEVLQRMEPWATVVLSTLALLPTMTAATAERLTGSQEAGALLEDLHRRNYFTTRDSAAEPRYRFHPLFRDFLLARLHSPATAQDNTLLKIRAAAVSEEDGQADGAVQLLAETGQVDLLVALVKRRAGALIADGRNDTLIAWLTKLDPDKIAGDPWLSYWRGTARVGFDPIDAYPYFLTALTLFEATEDTVGQFLAWTGAAEAIRLDPFGDMARFDPLLVKMHRLLERHPAIPSPGLEVSVSASMATALSRRGSNRTEFESWKARAQETARALRAPGLSIRLGFAFAIMDLMDGNFTASTEALDTLPDPLTLDAFPLAQWAGIVLQTLAFNHGQRSGDFATFVNEALNRLDQTGMLLWKPMVAANAAMAAWYRNDNVACNEWRLRTAAYAEAAGITRGPIYYAVTAGQKIMEGDAAGALRESDRALELALKGGWRYFVTQAQFLRALSHFTAHALNETATALDATDAALAQSLSGSLSFSSKLLRAELIFTSGNEAAGRASLAAALALGRSRGAKAALLMTRPIMASLCKRALDFDIEREFTLALVRNSDLASPDPHDAAWPWPIRIRTLGSFSIEIDGEPLAFSGKAPRKLIALVKAIAAYGGRAVPETKIADALWPDEEADAALNSLRIAIHRLRKLFGDNDAIVVSNGTIGLHPTRCWLDLWAFEGKLTRRGPQETQETFARRIVEGLALYRGDFLPEDDDAWWATERRGALRKRYRCTLAPARPVL